MKKLIELAGRLPAFIAYLFGMCGFIFAIAGFIGGAANPSIKFTALFVAGIFIILTIGVGKLNRICS